MFGQTMCTAELCPTMWTLADYAQGSGVALVFSVGLELAAFLGGHVAWWIDRQGRVGSDRVENGHKEDELTNAL